MNQVVFGHQGSIEMQEMALTVKFRGHLGGQIDFIVFSVTFGIKGL